MARTPKPWYRQERDGWYATVDGKQRLLATGKQGKSAAEKELRRILHDRDHGRPLQRSGGPMVGELLAAYMADLRRRVQDEGLSHYRPADVLRRLSGLDEALGDRLAREITVAEIKQWLLGRPGWSGTTRADAVGEIRALFRWAVREGRLESNPVEGLRAPPRRERREQVIAPEQVEEVLAEIQSPEFRDLFLFLWLTGCRPKEARTLEARHVDWQRCVIVRSDHKSYARTRKARVIPLSWAAYWLVARLASLHPTGPLFLNQAGRPWTKDAVHNQVWRLRERTGLGGELVAYALRHGFATRLLKATGDLALGAAVLGHSSTAMLSRVYGHLEKQTEHLRRAVDELG